MLMNRSQARIAWAARDMTKESSMSPNQMMSGRSQPPHSSHRYRP